MLNEKCTEQIFYHMEDALGTLLKGLRDYKEGESNEKYSVILEGIANCQLGSRNAMMGLLRWDIPMGLSHAIGHQLGSICGVMHGITSCIMLAPALRYTASKSDKQKEVQQRVLKIWNRALYSEETNLSDAVCNFVKYLGLPSTLKEAGVEKQDDIDKVVESTMTDVFGAMEGMGGKDDVVAIVNAAKG